MVIGEDRALFNSFLLVKKKKGTHSIRSGSRDARCSRKILVFPFVLIGGAFGNMVEFTVVDTFSLYRTSRHFKGASETHPRLMLIINGRNHVEWERE